MHNCVDTLKAVRRIITAPIGSSNKPSITICAYARIISVFKNIVNGTGFAPSITTDI
jgi:hypothetical protein